MLATVGNLPWQRYDLSSDITYVGEANGPMTQTPAKPSSSHPGRRAYAVSEPPVDPLSRRTFVQSTAAAAATAALGASAATWAAPAAARGPFVPYGARSYFKKPVTGAPVDAARTQAFRSFMRSHPEQRDVAYPLINGLDGNEWGTPFAIGEQHHPVWRLTGDHDKKARRLATRGFHAPDWLGRMLTGTDDSPLCVLDRASGFTMFCANARVVGPTSSRRRPARSPTTAPTGSTTATRAPTSRATSPAAGASRTRW